MSSPILQSALKLTRAQRILLVEQLWDSIAEQQEGPELTPAQKAELDRRIKRLEKTGSQGSDWATVKRRIMRRKAS